MKKVTCQEKVGRELYTSPKIFITLNQGEYYEDKGKMKVSPKTIFTVSEIGYDEARNINALTIVDNKGVVRYKLGQVQETPKSEEQQTFEEQMESYIKPALAQARTEEDVKRIWDDYTAYQNIPAFVSVVTNRLGEIRKAA